MRGGINPNPLACTQALGEGFGSEPPSLLGAPAVLAAARLDDADAARLQSLAPWPRRQKPQRGPVTSSRWASVNFLLLQASYRQFNQTLTKSLEYPCEKHSN